MNIIVPLPPAHKKGEMFILLVTVYFTKLVEAEGFANVTNLVVRNLIWKHILYRFRVSNEIVTENGSQFISKILKDFYISWNIRLNFSTLRYPKANGQAKATNKTLSVILKITLRKHKCAWVQEFSSVLWSYRTTPRVPISQTLFSLIFRVEVILPSDMDLDNTHYMTSSYAGLRSRHNQ